MKKLTVLSTLFVLIFSVALNAQSTTIAVLPFTGLAQGQANLLAGMLGTELRKNGNYQIAPRTPAITEAFREQTVQRSGLTDTMTISELGKGANARYVVSAHVHSIGEQKVIAASIIDVESFQQVSGDYLTYNVEKEVIDYMPSMAKMLLSGMGNSNKRLPTLAIFPLTSESEASETDRDVLAQILSIELSNSGKYAVVIRTSSLSNVMKEHNIQRQGFTDDATVAEVGNAINANYVLYGDISKFGDDGYISTYIVDVETITQEIGAYGSYNKIENIVKVIPNLSYDITGIKSTILLARIEYILELCEAKKGQEGISDMQALLKTGNINAKSNDGKTALHLASRNGDTEMAKVLIAAGADVNAKDIYDWTALHQASYYGYIETVKYLISAGADVDAKTNYGWTALHQASYYGYIETVKYLISAGADVNAKTNDGETVLYYAEKQGRTAIANYLKSVGGAK